MSTQNNKTWYQKADSALRSWETDFMNNVSLYETELEVDAGELEVIQDAGQAFLDAMAALTTAKGAYEAAVQAKDTARAALIEVNQGFIAQWQALPNLDPKILETLGVPQRGTRGQRTAPTTPENLIAKAQVNGEVFLTYSRSGNSQTTVFTVEQSEPDSTTWTPIFSSTRTRVRLTGYTPGVETRFRVRATRNGMVSSPSEWVPIWGGGLSEEEAEQLRLAA